MTLISLLSECNNFHKLLFLNNIEKWFLSCQSSIRKQACSSRLAFFCYLLSMQKMPTFQLVILKGSNNVIEKNACFVSLVFITCLTPL